MNLERSEITWLILDGAKPCLDDLRQLLGEQGYQHERNALQDFLCGYFVTGTCKHQQGQSIAPMRSSNTQASGKCLKVRWATPGRGKSGGLRLAVVVYCESKVVKVAGAWLRREDPTAAEFGNAFGDG